MMTFQVEKWWDFVPDAAPVFEQHWKDLALHQDKVRMEMDADLYTNAEKAGMLLVCTIREEGRLVGYSIYFIRTHAHYKSTVVGFTDMYYILPEHRRAGAGARLFAFAEEELKRRGVKLSITSCKVHQDHQRLFEALGFTFSDKTFVKYIG